MGKVAPAPVYEALKGAAEIIAAKDARIAALEAQIAERVKVKPLEWTYLDTPYVIAKSEVGIYLIHFKMDLRYHLERNYTSLGEPCGSLEEAKAVASADHERRIFSTLEATPPAPKVTERKFKLGERVTKIKGSRWTGHVVGFYSTELTPVGYAVESDTEKGSVQIYPEAALSVLEATPPAPKVTEAELEEKGDEFAADVLRSTP